MSENTDYNALKGKTRLTTEFKKRWLRAKRATPPLPLAHDEGDRAKKAMLARGVEIDAARAPMKRPAAPRGAPGAR